MFLLEFLFLEIVKGTIWENSTSPFFQGKWEDEFSKSFFGLSTEKLDAGTRIDISQQWPNDPIRAQTPFTEAEATICN